MLFLYFGCRLLKDASGMEGSAVSEELQEVEEELVGKKEECDDDDQSRCECDNLATPLVIHA